ncbi:MAG: MFS transporter [Lentimicrobiaceae bacterium]|nr:MFS transporter [Lentimicrobiaceae bacterium]
MKDLHRKKPAFYALMLATLAAALDLSVLGPSLPGIGQAFPWKGGALSWVFSAYTLANLLALPLAGFMAAWIGKRRLLLGGLLLFVLASFMLAMAGSMEMLLAARIVLGISASAIFPVIPSLLGDIATVEKRGTMLGALGSVFGLALLTGPLLAWGLLSHFDWRSLYWLTGSLALLAFAVNASILPSDEGGVRARLPLRSLMLLGLALLSWAALLSGTPITGLPVLLSSALWLAVGVTAGWFFVRTEKINADRILYKPYIRRRFFGFILMLALGTGIVQALYIYIPATLHAWLPVTESRASLMLVPVVLAFTAGNLVWGRMSDRWGPWRVLRFGWIFMGIALLLMGSLSGWGIWLLSAVCFGAGMSTMESPSLRYLMIHHTEPEVRTHAQSTLSVFISLGQLTGSAMLGGLGTLFQGEAIQQLFLFLIPMALVALWLTEKGRQTG